MKSNKTFRRNELAVAISLLLAAYPASYALAQDQDDADKPAVEEEMMAEEVIVTGIRRGLMNSVELKSTSSSIVEAISAEEIGKLPDISITDSLARLPGVTAQRLNGRSQVLSVRGLGPDFTTALMNGRPQVSAGDNRGVEFDQYPAEMISAGLVYKTPNATLMGQGLAGTIDMQTIRPLSYGEQAMVANLRYVWNDISALNDDAPDDGWRGSFTYVDQFMDDTLGIAIGIAHADTPTQSEKFEAWGYPSVGDESIGCPCALIGGSKPFAQSSNLERTGIVLSHEGAHSMLLDHGAWESDGRIKIPEPLIAAALGSAPSRILMHNRLRSSQVNNQRMLVRQSHFCRRIFRFPRFPQSRCLDHCKGLVRHLDIPYHMLHQINPWRIGHTRHQ